MATARSLFLLAVVALALAVYVNYPAPTQISKHLAKWEATAAKTKIVNGHRIFFKDESGTKTTGPVLVCLHGFPSSNYDWLKVWPALLEKFSRVIAADFLGYGFSDKPLDHQYSIMEQADIVEKLLEQLKVTDVHILAHDYGDTVAQELLARFEDRKASGQNGLLITSVCLLNGGIFPETNFPRFLQKALLIPYLEPILSRLTNIFLFSRGFGEVFGPKTQPTPEDYQDFWALIRKRDGHLVLGKLLQYIPERSAYRNRWTGVLKITTVPVHVIYGPADPVNPPGFVAFYKKTVPNPSISVLGGHIGHYPQWEDPKGCMKEYFDFLKKVPFTSPRQATGSDEAEPSIPTIPKREPPKELRHSTTTSKYKKSAKTDDGSATATARTNTQKRQGDKIVAPHTVVSDAESAATTRDETQQQKQQQQRQEEPSQEKQQQQQQQQQEKQQGSGTSANSADSGTDGAAGVSQEDSTIIDDDTETGQKENDNDDTKETPEQDLRKQEKTLSGKHTRKEFTADKKPQRPRREGN